MTFDEEPDNEQCTVLPTPLDMERMQLLASPAGGKDSPTEKGKALPNRVSHMVSETQQWSLIRYTSSYMLMMGASVGYKYFEVDDLYAVMAILYLIENIDDEKPMDLTPTSNDIKALKELKSEGFVVGEHCNWVVFKTHGKLNCMLGHRFEFRFRTVNSVHQLKQWLSDEHS